MILGFVDPAVERLPGASGMSEGRENQGEGARVESYEQPGLIMQRRADHERLNDAEDSDLAGGQPASCGGNLVGVQPDAVPRLDGSQGQPGSARRP